MSAFFNSFMHSEKDRKLGLEGEGKEEEDAAESKERDGDGDGDGDGDEERDGDDDGEEKDKEDEIEVVYEDKFGVGSLSELIDRLNREELKYGRDNGRYLILNAPRILRASFEPTFIDLLQCHVRSTGLMFENHVMCRSLPIAAFDEEHHHQRKEDMVFRVVDVGGHRNERKKWSYVLEQDNDVIVFVVSAASFCQVLFEDFKKNAMRESISVWTDVVTSMASKYNEQEDMPQIILVINKIDLFYQRWHLFPRYFPEFAEAMEPMERHSVLNYIKALYLDIAKEHLPRHSSYVHTVCTKLTDSLEIAQFDVEQIKHLLLETMDTHRDIVDTIIGYAVGDVFWSQKWLKPMWHRKVAQAQAQRTVHPSNHAQSQTQCDHVNHPHEFHRHRRSKRRSKSSKAHKASSPRKSLSQRVSAIFQ